MNCLASAGVQSTSTVTFFSMLLGQVLFLTSVWDYSVLRAGLAITPTPLSATVVAIPAGRLAHRVGFRPFIVGGSLFMAFALFLMMARLGGNPAYLAYLEESGDLLTGPPEVEAVEPLWSKAVGPDDWPGFRGRPSLARPCPPPARG